MLTPEKLAAKPVSVPYDDDVIYIRRLTAADLLNMHTDPLAKLDYYMASLYWGDEDNNRLITDEKGLQTISSMPADVVMLIIDKGRELNGTGSSKEVDSELEKA